MLACASSCLSNSSIVSVSTAARAFLFVYSFFFFKGRKYKLGRSYWLNTKLSMDKTDQQLRARARRTSGAGQHPGCISVY